MAASVTYLMPGMPFMYYGEEILLKGKRNTSPDDQTDVKRRLPMIWDGTSDEGLCAFPENGKEHLDTTVQVKDGVKQQLETDYSVLNHYKKVIQNVGLVLFVGSVGFIAGPKFFRDLKKNFKTYILMGVVIILIGTAVAVTFTLISPYNKQYSLYQILNEERLK